MREIAEPFERDGATYCLVDDCGAWLTKLKLVDGEWQDTNDPIYKTDQPFLDPELLPRVGKALPPVPRKVKEYEALDEFGQTMMYRCGKLGVEWKAKEWRDWNLVRDFGMEHWQKLTPSELRAIADALEDGGAR